MKLRFHDKSVRLRLSQSDLSVLGERGRVQERIPLPGDGFVYALEAADEVDRLDAALEGSSLLVRLPAAWVPEWIASDQVGFEAAVALDDGDALQILVEKDFQCLHTDSGEADAFPHPDAADVGRPAGG